MLPSGFYSVFFPLNKTESPCQLGRGLRTRASQCVRLAGGQCRIKCPLPLEESGPHRSGGGWGVRAAGAGGSYVCNTSATGRGVSTNSAVCWEQSLWREGLGHAPSAAPPGVWSPWPGEAKPLSLGQVTLPCPPRGACEPHMFRVFSPRSSLM